MKAINVSISLGHLHDSARNFILPNVTALTPDLSDSNRG
jgi:hypothetical protein